MDNILALHADLESGTYHHGPYKAFKIHDPKPRDIHKATVRDRLVHHAVYRILYPHFDTTFIPDSYSCRKNKGTHKAINQFRKYFYKTSKNNTQTCWVLKCDIKKFFASIDQEILLNILSQRVADKKTINLLREIITSFYPGLPLGNLTSQLFVNIYMNEFDWFIKEDLRIKQYIRYADDFVILSHNRSLLEKLIPLIQKFLRDNLRLTAHKISIRTVASGIDFLGWVHFPDHRVLRTNTKRRMFARIKKDSTPEALASYWGMLRHGNTYKLMRSILWKK